MRDIRLEEIPFEFDGKTYMLRCNMNVLADVQAAFGGTISGALSGENPTQSVLEFLAAMLNDYADEMDWPERWTAKQLGRKLPLFAVKTVDVMGLVTRSIAPPADDAAPVSEPDTSEEPPEDSGN